MATDLGDFSLSDTSGDWLMNTPEEVALPDTTDLASLWADNGWAMSTPEDVNSWMTPDLSSSWTDSDWAMSTPEEINALLSANTEVPDASNLYALGNKDLGYGYGVTLEDVLKQGVNLTDMGGGQGATVRMPAQYYAEGTVDEEGNSIAGKEIPMSAGTMTELGMVPDTGASIALGDPNSWINNPNITGDRVVVSPDNIVTSGTAYRYNNQPSSFTTSGERTPGAVSNFGTTQGLKTTTASGGQAVTPGTNSSALQKIVDAVAGGGASAGSGQQSGNNWMQMLMMMLLLSQMNKGGSSGTTNAVIPQLTATRTLNSALPQQMANRRSGSAPLQYFQQPNAVQYAAEGGVMGGGLASLGQYAAGGKGRLVAGDGDGVSDDIPATIDGQQPARIARGEYVIPARVVAELGNGSTDAGAERLDNMVAQIESAGRKAKRGTDSKAYNHLPT